MLHKEAWVAALLGTHLSIQVHKKVQFSRRNILFLAVKGLNKNMKIVKKVTIFDSLKINLWFLHHNQIPLML